MDVIEEIDRFGKKCLLCNSGTYAESSIQDSWDGILTCSNCLDIIERYITIEMPSMPGK